MERNNNNEFERFLKENADQYRLYPSTKVWKGIHSALHTRRKWYGLGFALLLLTGTLITILITNSSKQTAIALRQSPAQQQQASVSTPAVFGIYKTPGLIKTPNSFTANNNFVRDNQYIILPPENDVTNNQPTTEKESLFQTRDLINTNTVRSDIPQLSSINKLSHPEPLAINNSMEAPGDDILNNISGTKRTFINSKQTAGSNTYNWTIESVLNSYSNSRKVKRVNLQLNFTPTVSYRKLSENKSFSQTSSPYTFAPFYDINSAVTHKPDMGLELGLTAKYSLASNFKVKAGLQFNVNRYDIKAFNYPNEVATIALNRGDSFRTISTYRNFSGGKSNWLQNLYFQISIPVGVEVKIAGDEKVQFGIAGTIQPTYVLGDRAYLLSTDYKNYAEVPWLIRRWNANTAFETFVSYSTGKLKWQVGPQVRYQLLSSFIDKYPVKENLFDFGLKVGISLNQ